MSDENTATILQAISELKTDVNGLKTDVNGLKSDFAALKSDVTGLKSEVHDLNKELGQTQKWQDRTWDVVKWVGGISAGLSISAAIAFVGLLIRATK